MFHYLQISCACLVGSGCQWVSCLDSTSVFTVLRAILYRKMRMETDSPAVPWGKLFWAKTLWTLSSHQKWGCWVQACLAKHVLTFQGYSLGRAGCGPHSSRSLASPEAGRMEGGRLGDPVMELLLHSPPRIRVGENRYAEDGMLTPSVRRAAGGLWASTQPGLPLHSGDTSSWTRGPPSTHSQGPVLSRISWWWSAHCSDETWLAA